MNGITHKQAQKYLRLDLDGLLTDDQRLDLETHLSGCEACRVDAQAFSTLTSRLQSEFHSRWDAQDGPSKNVMANVRSQTWRIIMSNRINFGLRAFAGIAAVLVFGFLINLVVSQMRDQAIVANATATPDSFMPVSSPGAEKRLVAFTMEKDGNLDIYTIRVDGTELTNLTNSPEREDNPYWSPDGKHIAFNYNIRDQQQIFMMDADGSNVIQLTDDGISNKLVSFEEGREAGFDAWSPDGSKLVFVKEDFSQANNGRWMKLYVLNVETKTQTPLTSEGSIYGSPAWSPDGARIAFTSMTINEKGEPDHISVQVANTDGSRLVDLTGSLPDDEFPFMSFSYWSRDGGSIFFISYGVTSKANKVYEARLDGTLIEHANGTGILDWWNGTTLRQTNSRLDWLHEDGTQFTLSTCGTRFSSRRSNTGDLFFGVYCTDSKWTLYLANEDGSRIEQLLDDPIAFTGGGLDAAWSPDNQYIAFNLSSQYKTEMYILNVTGTLNDPSTPPFSIDVGDVFSFADSISWQPVIPDEIVERKRTPEPTQTSPDIGLIAFTSAVENGNLDIYTMYPDGSDLTNLTNNPAHDVNPYWSPDGERIAFMSDRAGFMQIFVMNADGSNVIQVTDNEANHEFGISDHGPWSPDGSRLLFNEWAPANEKWMLYAIGIDGQNKTRLADVPNIYTSPSWSPDGKHVAFVVPIQQEGSQGREVIRIQVVDANGENLTDATRLVPSDEDLVSFKYSWSSDGQSISFIASRYYYENGNGKSTYYQASLDGNSLVEIGRVSTIMGDWWNGTSLIQSFGTDVLTWLRPDGTHSTFNAYKNCKEIYTQYGLNHKRSTNGDLIISAKCDDDEWLYWANPDGTVIQPLLNYPIRTKDISTSMYWSPDGRYVALSTISSDITYLYVVNISDALSDPSTQLVQIPLAGGAQYYNISWQPIP